MYQEDGNTISEKFLLFFLSNAWGNFFATFKFDLSTKSFLTKVISKILQLSNTTQIIWIRGNHDEFIQDFIGTHLGRIEIKEDYRLTIQRWVENDVYRNENYYVFHGDVVDVFITKYKWLSNDFALTLNRWYNTYRKWRNLPYQSISQKIKGGVKAATNYINDFETTALSMAHKKGCNGVICGHIHQPEDRIIDGKRYLNSGDWVENMSAILIDSYGKVYIYNIFDTIYY